MPETIENHGYMSMAFKPDSLISYAEKNLAGVDFDTFVGTGLSGGLVVPLMAWYFNKFAFIIRKESDRAHTTAHQGTFGKRWIFVDDCIASGRTQDRVFAEIAKLAKHNYNFSTEYVGTYLYQDGPGNGKSFKDYEVTGAFIPDSGRPMWLHVRYNTEDPN